MPYYSGNVDSGATSLDLYSVDSSKFPSSGGSKSCTTASGGTFTGYYAGSSPIYTTIVQVQSSLSGYSWADIKTLSDALVAGTITSSVLSSVYNISVGSTKSSTINGESHNYRLIGLLHDVDANDNKLGMTFQQTEFMNNKYEMDRGWYSNSYSYGNDGGCEIYKNILPGFSIASDLSAVITAAKKKDSTIPANKTQVSERSMAPHTFTAKLWIPSTVELTGTNAGICYDEGSQYEYYANGGSTVMSSSNNTFYWSRSMAGWYSQWSTYYFQAFIGNVNGGTIIKAIHDSTYTSLVPCFCI